MPKHDTALTPLRHALGPLPPVLQYDSELVAGISKAERHLGELAGLARQLSNPELLIRPLLSQEAVLSSRIEGTETEIGEFYTFEAGHPHIPELGAHAPADDVEEVRNYAAALRHGLARLEELPVSLRLIRELHEILLAGARGRNRAPGQFRKIQNWIGPPGRPIEEATYRPPSASEVVSLMGDLEKYANAEEPADPPLVRLAFIHYQFEAIHPFLDGNGRIGRLLIGLLLVQWQLLPLPVLYLSAYFERRRARYYDLLQAVSAEANWRGWVSFFVEGVSVQAQEACRTLTSLQGMQERWRSRLMKPGSSSLAVKLSDRVIDRPILSIPQAAEFLGCTYPTAKKHVETVEVA